MQEQQILVVDELHPVPSCAKLFVDLVIIEMKEVLVCLAGLVCGMCGCIDLHVHMRLIYL